MNYKRLLGTASAALMIVMVTLALAPGSWAQSKYKTLYKFKSVADGYFPWADVIFDQAGNLYGTTNAGGDLKHCNGAGCGVVFKLTPNANGSWTKKTLYDFKGIPDGAAPQAALIFDKVGNLYGTTPGGGRNGGRCRENDGCGTVFQLVPKADGSWEEKILHRFTGPPDGAYPSGSLIFDAAGNLYGVTYAGGNGDYCRLGCGTAFELTPNVDGSWSESVIYNFNEENLSGGPGGGLTFDATGNLYGATGFGGANGYGSIFQLSPAGDGSWTENTIYSFGYYDRGPNGGLVFDTAGNLYGTTEGIGGSNSGTVFELTPDSDGSWTEGVLHEFTGGSDGGFPMGGVIVDAMGNVYGTASLFGDLSCGCGTVFKLTPTSGNDWKFTVLHTFLGHPGREPWASLVFDAAGNVYGTTVGTHAYEAPFGSVFEITP